MTNFNEVMLKKWRYCSKEDLIKNMAMGFGVGAAMGLFRGYLLTTLIYGLFAAIVFGFGKSYLDNKSRRERERDNFERLLKGWMQSVIMMLASGAHPHLAIGKSAEAFTQHEQFKVLAQSLKHLNDSFSPLLRLSEYAQILELQRFNARLALYETQGNKALLELMENDLSAYTERLIAKGQIQIEKSIVTQALPALLIFATVMILMMYPLLLGGI